ncbi:hypothetical protein M408DRAFT_27138 [Serendipita vermifera MAFF 305830]|uniref:PNPLA domain-containing protein n=1 Tax=Serendipita vermifera MAFF 305830 TaxID=933852 RepID=A0A0C2X4M8_SERVB|nr:hypothetical protein M408DRAFT_27138 [Serendipita vermifera MAFF 305830]
MPTESGLAGPERERGLCLLSLDAGGARAMSQLKILSHIMYILNSESNFESNLRPCDVFDMVAGSGSGGFIAILLTRLEFTAERALDVLGELNKDIFMGYGKDAQTRTNSLKNWVDTFLEKHDINKKTCLMTRDGMTSDSKLVVPLSYKGHVESTCTLRNFRVRQEQALDLTIAEALLATLPTPPVFEPLCIFKDAVTFDYIGGDLVLSNPIRLVIMEAYGAFGPDRHVACLLSVGCGHPGLSSTPSGSSLDEWNEFLRKITTSCLKDAQTADIQMGHLGLYHRFSVTRGLETAAMDTKISSEEMITQTMAYMDDFDLSDKMERCVELLKLKDGTASLEQLKRSGGEKVSAPPLPSLTDAFVMRHGPWEFVKNAICDPENEQDSVQQRFLLITGMGGCGKTQLVRKFIEEYRHRFSSVFFIDGSSEDRIRADLVRNVRPLSTECSQYSFKECLRFLSQPVIGSTRLIVYDNVDNPELELPPLLPAGGNCAIIITSRNRSIGGISRRAHLELDVMSKDEAVELLLRDSTNLTAEEAGTIAHELGRLPIALVQARSYMFQTRCSGDTYLQRLESSRNKLLAQPIKNQPDLRYMSTYAAFSASFDLLSLRNQNLLRLLSYFHWARFPQELITQAVEHDFSNQYHVYIRPTEDEDLNRQLLKDVFLLHGIWDFIE